LAATANKQENLFSEEQKENFKNNRIIWVRSFKKFIIQIDRIAEHNLNDTIALNKAKEMLCIMSEPLVKTLKQIQIDKDNLKKKNQAVYNLNVKQKALEGRHNSNDVVFDLSYYTQTNSSCQICSTVFSESAYRNVNNTEQIKKNQLEINEISKFIKLLETSIKVNEEELKQIIMIAANFAFFSQKNEIMPLKNDFEKCLEINKLKEVEEKFNKEKKTLENANVALSNANISELMEKSFSLSKNGEALKTIYAKGKCDEIMQTIFDKVDINGKEFFNL
jgi:hypothetical protein